MNVVDYVTTILGTPSESFEWLVYVISAFILITFLWSILNILNAIFKFVSGQR